MQDQNVKSAADYYLDITADVCPMTFVKTRLLIERMAPGATAEVRLKGAEPLVNVPQSVKELGHAVLGLAPEPGTGSGDAAVHRMVLRKKKD
jgi:TusA-related sulfurtransferase